MALQTQTVTQLKKQNAVRPVSKSSLISGSPHSRFSLPVRAGLDLPSFFFVIFLHSFSFISPSFCPPALPLSSPSSLILILNAEFLSRQALMLAVLCQQVGWMLLCPHDQRESFHFQSISTAGKKKLPYLCTKAQMISSFKQATNKKINLCAPRLTSDRHLLFVVWRCSASDVNTVCK